MKTCNFYKIMSFPTALKHACTCACALQAVGGVKVAAERVEQMITNPAAAWAQAGAPIDV